MPRGIKGSPHRFKHCLPCGMSFEHITQNLNRRKFCSNDCARDYMRAKGPERFWAKVDKNGPGGCWLYTGFKKWDGYGWIARSDGGGKYKWLTAHRYAWILTNGEPPEDMHVLHRCDNPPCCNPAHLFLGSHKDNMADRVAKGRHRMGKIFKDRVRPKRGVHLD